MCPYPVIFSPFRILTICLVYTCYRNISKNTTVTFTVQMLKQILLHTCFITCIFHVIAFVIVPFKLEFSSGFPTYMWEDKSDSYYQIWVYGLSWSFLSTNTDWNILAVKVVVRVICLAFSKKLFVSCDSEIGSINCCR